MRSLYFVFSFFVSMATFSQSKRDINLNVNWDNDMYFNVDRYYTNGVEISVDIDKSKYYKKNYFVSEQSRVQEHHMTTLALHHKMFTPRGYKSSALLKKDRPYAGALYGVIGGRKTHANHESIYTELQLGILGPYTGAQPIQTEWHSLLNTWEPGGWEYQMKTSFILNYNLQYDRSLLRLRKLALIGTGRAEIGTYQINLQLGTTLLIGHFNHPFYGVKLSRKNKRSWSSFVTVNPVIKVVGYNATLQGSSFHNEDPHSFDASQISTFVFRNSVSINLMKRSFIIGFSGTIESPEFINARGQLYGTLKTVFLL